MSRKPRIVSLLPSATEIAVALGLETQLHGRSHQCDFPPGIAKLPVCTSTKLAKGLSSRAIEDRVREIVARGLSVYDVDAPLLRSLRPDVILTQAQCAVCAVTPADLQEALDEWTGSRPELVSLAPDDLADVHADIVRVGEAVGERSRAQRVVDEMQAAIHRLAGKPRSPRPRMLAIEWLDPLMVAGNWVPDLVSAAGAEPLLADSGEHSHGIAFESVAAADPDLIVLMPCGYRLEQTLAEARPLFATERWRALRAVRSGCAYAVDGHHLFNRPGPRLVESARLLAAILARPDVLPAFAERV